MNVEYIVFCENASLASNGVPSFGNVFDAINSSQFPTGIKDARIVVLVDGPEVVPGATMTFTFKDPEGNDLFEGRAEVPAAVDNNRYRHIFNVPVLPFFSEGEYRGILSFGGVEIGSAKVFANRITI